ncbi:LysR family transcriptional regulator [Paenibacillus contaminans]|uniref:LysR family transcriptional regulator n=1 Tax=Paenibacillus contaminans TaxID=450362 RepID=A0A329MM59_9BACL|nr:LysR substrate-binding domain-containing protein [Paenibacillus contaminans]RAV20959.1 LysR family transcriptional regulator [Paenibacillus contaminans]
MEFRLLAYFLAVCEELHFTRAAEKLGISQPTLSHQIRLLEKRLGTSLFRRIGKKTYLTEAGEILQKHCIRAFHELEQAQTAIDELRGVRRGRLRIGCSGNHLLTSALMAFHSQYPDIELSVTELATDETMDGLLSNRLDIGVVFLPLDDEQMDSIPLFDERLLLVVSSAHKLADAAFVKLDELRHIDLVLLQSKFLVRQMFDQYCIDAGFVPKPIMELSTLDSLLQMAARHIGGAILPGSYVAHVEDPSIRKIPIVEPVPHKTVGVVYPKEMFRYAVINTFIAELVSHFQTAAEEP